MLRGVNEYVQPAVVQCIDVAPSPSHVATRQPEYLEAKAKWEATVGKLEELTNHTQELVRAREVVYDKLVSTSLSAYSSGGAVSNTAAR